MIQCDMNIEEKKLLTWPISCISHAHQPLIHAPPKQVGEGAVVDGGRLIDDLLPQEQPGEVNLGDAVGIPGLDATLEGIMGSPLTCKNRIGVKRTLLKQKENSGARSKSFQNTMKFKRTKFE